MAYTPTITVAYVGGRDILVTITETECAAGSIATITGLPKKGVVISQLADLTAGSGGTVDPKLNTASGSSLATQTVVENGTAAAAISNLADPPVPYYSATGTLYHQSVPGGNTDNVVSTVYIIKAGW